MITCPLARALLVLALAGCGWAQPSPYRDVPLEAMVRASSGRLAICARNLQTGEEIALNAVVWRHLGDGTRLLAAAAALARRRELGLSLDATITRGPDAYRGGGGPVGSVTGPVSLKALIRASLRDNDRTATDLLISWLGPALAQWMTQKGLDMSRPTTVAERDRLLAGALDPGLASSPPHLLAKWLRDRDAKAVVPAHVARDPRRQADHTKRLASAWSHYRGLRVNQASPRSVTGLVASLVRGDLGHPDDVKRMRRLLRGVGPLRLARDLPVHLVPAGIDAVDWDQQTSCGFVETAAGTVVLYVDATGYGLEEEGSHFLSLLAGAAVRRLAPGTFRSPKPSPRPAALRQLALVDAPPEEAPDAMQRRPECRTFRKGTHATLFMRAAPTAEELVVQVRWTLPGGGHRAERCVFPPREFTDRALRLPLATTGDYVVEIGCRGAMIKTIPFRTLPAQPAKTSR